METSNYNYTKQTQRVKLGQYGFEQAGLSMGEPQKFEGYLNEIYKGHLIDEDIVTGKTEEEKEIIKENISKLRNDISDKKALKKQIEEIKIPAEETKKKGLAETIEEIKKKIITGPQPNWMMFGIILVVLSALSIYLFFFYVTVFYDALSGATSVNLIPKATVFFKAIKQNPIILTAPTIVLALGVAIHSLLEKEGNLKYLYIGMILMFTFILDWLLADIIYTNIKDTNDILGSITPPRMEYSKFWIIIFMGFVVYIIWSVLFHSLVTEFKKKDASAWEQYQIKKLRKDIDGLTDIITNQKLDASKLEAECEGLNQKIDHEKARIVEVLISKNDLLHSLSQFSNGWNSYYRPDVYANHREKLELTNKIVSDFEQKIHLDFKENNEKSS